MEVLRKYAAITKVIFPLIDAGAQDFEDTPVTFASGDTQISKDEGTFANATNNPIHEGNGIYSLVLEVTEMTAGRIVVTIIDQTATKAWEDQAVVISTYGHASAQHAFDLDDAEPGVDVVKISGDSTAADNLELMYDGTGYVGGTTKLGVNIVQISDDATAATNLEAMYDGTGYVGGTAKLTVDVVKIGGNTTAVTNLKAMYDGTGYAGGTVKLGVDAVQISGDATAANNLESMYDGTGYAGGTIKLTVDVVKISGDQGAADSLELDYDGTGFNKANSQVGTVNSINGMATGAITAAALSAAGANKLADHIIRRTFQNACDSANGDTKTGRSLLGAVAKLVNKVAIAGSTLTVYEDDDTTSLFTQTVTTDAAADPVTALDTV